MESRKQKDKSRLDIFCRGAEFNRIRYKECSWIRLWLHDGDHNLQISTNPESETVDETIALAAINEVRYGFRTDVFSVAMRNGADLDESRCFSVVYNGRKNSLDLQTMDESPHAAQDWYRGLKYLIESLKMRHDLNSFLHDKFKQADTDNSRSLNFRETWQLMRSLNIHLPREQVSFHYCLCSVTVTRFDRFFHSLLK